MAVDFTSTVHIDASPEKVVDAITDLSAWKIWMPNLVAVEALSEGPIAEGSRWRETRKMFGKEAVEEFEVRVFEPPNSMTLCVDGSKGTTGKGEYRFDYTFEPVKEGTLLTLHGHIDMPGIMFKLMGRMLAGTFKKACEKDHQALKRYLEGSKGVG